MMILDTHHVAQLQRVGSRDAAVIEARLHTVPITDLWITVITPYEQLREALGRINSEQSPEKQVARFSLFQRMIDYYATYWKDRILPFDERAARVLGSFEPKLIRSIGARDARIAAIALVHRATVLTANMTDFQRVPGISVSNWLRGSPDHPEFSP